MKKTYIAPAIYDDTMDLCILAAASNIKGYYGDKNELYYGGVDELGEINPSSRQFTDWLDDNDIW